MRRLQYKDANILNDSLKLIKQREPFCIVIEGWRVALLRKAVPVSREYLLGGKSAQGIKKLLAIPRLMFYWMLCPTIWGIVISASLNRMIFDYKSEEGFAILWFTDDSVQTYVHYHQEPSSSGKT